MMISTMTPSAVRHLFLFLYWSKLTLMLFLSGVPQAAEANNQHQDANIESQLDDLIGVGRYPKDVAALEHLAKQIEKDTAFETFIRAQGNLILWQGLEKKQVNAAIKQAQLLYEEAKVVGSVNSQAEMLAVQCAILFQHGKVTEYMALLPGLERHLENVDSPRLLFHINLLISKLWQLSTQQELTLKYALRAQDAAAQMKDKFQLQRRLQLNIHIASTEVALQHYAAAADLLADSIKQALKYKEETQLAELYLLSGFAERHKSGPTDKAINFYLQAVDWARKTENSRAMLMALNNIGATLIFQKKYPQAEAYLLQAREILPKDELASDRVIIDFNLGYLQVLQGNSETGIKVMEEKAAQFRKIGRPDHVAHLLNHLADAYNRMGQYQLQVQILQEKLELLNKYYLEERPKLVNEMQIRYQANDKALQLELLNQRLEIQEHENQNQKRVIWMAFLLGFAAMIVLAVTFFAYRKIRTINQLLNDQNEQLHQLSLRDPLTGLKNRRAIELPADNPETIDSKFKLPRRRATDETALLVLLDIDRFKQINDNFGHAVGDEVLLAFASRLKQFCRTNDQVLRWGGEEFLLLLANIKAQDAIQTIGRLQHLLTAHPVETGAGPLQVSASGGFLLLDSPTPQQADLWHWQLKMVDFLLYRGKQHGRNRLFGWLAAPEFHAQQDAEEQLEYVQSELVVVVGPEFSKTEHAI